MKTRIWLLCAFVMIAAFAAFLWKRATPETATQSPGSADRAGGTISAGVPAQRPETGAAAAAPSTKTSSNASVRVVTDAIKSAESRQKTDPSAGKAGKVMPEALKKRLAEWKSLVAEIIKGGATTELEARGLARNLREMLAGSFEYRAEILAMLTGDLAAKDDKPGSMTREERLQYFEQLKWKSLIEEASARAWGAEEPERYADSLRSLGVSSGPQVEGWLMSQFESGRYEPGILDKYGFSVDKFQMRSVLMTLAEDSPFASLRAMFQFPDRYFDLGHPGVGVDVEMLRSFCVAAANRDANAVVEWLDANKGGIGQEQYNVLIQALRMKSAESVEPLYLPPDAERVSGFCYDGNFTAAASLLADLRTEYGNKVDGQLARLVLFEWQKEDPESAYGWLIANMQYLDNPETLFDPIFRTWGLKDPGKAFQAVSSIGVSNVQARAHAMSNLIIANAEVDPARIDDARIRNLPSDFVKARSIAGFVLGSSRHYGDADLEVAVKRQFLADRFDLQSLSAAVDASHLPPDAARRAREMIASY